MVLEIETWIVAIIGGLILGAFLNSLYHLWKEYPPESPPGTNNVLVECPFCKSLWRTSDDIDRIMTCLNCKKAFSVRWG